MGIVRESPSWHWRETRHEWSYLNAPSTSALVASHRTDAIGLPLHGAHPQGQATPHTTKPRRAARLSDNVHLHAQTGALAAVVRRRYDQFE